MKFTPSYFGTTVNGVTYRFNGGHDRGWSDHNRTIGTTSRNAIVEAVLDIPVLKLLPHQGVNPATKPTVTVTDCSVRRLMFWYENTKKIKAAVGVHLEARLEPPLSFTSQATVFWVDHHWSLPDRHIKPADRVYFLFPELLAVAASLGFDRFAFKFLNHKADPASAYRDYVEGYGVTISEDREAMICRIDFADPATREILAAKAITPKIPVKNAEASLKKEIGIT